MDETIERALAHLEEEVREAHEFETIYKGEYRGFTILIYHFMVKNKVQYVIHNSFKANDDLLNHVKLCLVKNFSDKQYKILSAQFAGDLIRINGEFTSYDGNIEFAENVVDTIANEVPGFVKYESPYDLDMFTNVLTIGDDKSITYTYCMPVHENVDGEKLEKHVRENLLKTLDSLNPAAGIRHQSTIDFEPIPEIHTMKIHLKTSNHLLNHLLKSTYLQKNPQMRNVCPLY